MFHRYLGRGRRRRPLCLGRTAFCLGSSCSWSNSRPRPWAGFLAAAPLAASISRPRPRPRPRALGLGSSLIAVDWHGVLGQCILYRTLYITYYVCKPVLSNTQDGYTVSSTYIHIYGAWCLWNNVYASKYLSFFTIEWQINVHLCFFYQGTSIYVVLKLILETNRAVCIHACDVDVSSSSHACYPDIQTCR